MIALCILRRPILENFDELKCELPLVDFTDEACNFKIVAGEIPFSQSFVGHGATLTDNGQDHSIQVLFSANGR
jgi:hypothetical protein